MNNVQPIRDARKLKQMKDCLNKHHAKYGMMFTLGINTGLRVGDLLTLRVEDVQSDHIVIVEQKTGKTRRFLINRQLRSALDKYIRDNDLTAEDYLIKSQKGQNRPISRVQAYTILNTAAKECGIEDAVGTHTMRKTFGYWHYQTHRDVAILQQIFGHSSPSITLRYIGITDDILDKSVEDFFL